jgi:seryl-tRNA synthetase
LPKFKEDMFWVTRGGDEAQATEQYLISTSRSLADQHRARQILRGEQLPIKLTAHSPCFRSARPAAPGATRAA